MQALHDDCGCHQQPATAAQPHTGMQLSNWWRHSADASNPAAATVAPQANQLHREPMVFTRPAAAIENAPVQESEKAAQPVAGGTGLSVEEALTLHAGHLPSQHCVVAFPEGHPEPISSTSPGPAAHWKALPAQDGPSPITIAHRPKAFSSSAGRSHSGRLEHDGPVGSDGGGNHAGQQPRQASKHDGEKRRAHGRAASGKTREHAVRKEPRSGIPIMVTPTASTGSEHDRSPRRSTSPSHAKHASRRMSRTGQRSTSSAIRRCPASPSRLVKKVLKERSSTSGGGHEGRREAGSDSSQSLLSRRVYGPRQRKVGAGSAAWLRTQTSLIHEHDQHAAGASGMLSMTTILTASA